MVKVLEDDGYEWVDTAEQIEAEAGHASEGLTGFEC